MAAVVVAVVARRPRRRDAQAVAAMVLSVAGLKLATKTMRSPVMRGCAACVTSPPKMSAVPMGGVIRHVGGCLSASEPPGPRALRDQKAVPPPSNLVGELTLSRHVRL